LRTTAARWIVVGTVGLSALLIQVPALAERVHVSPLHLEDWGLAALAGLLASLPLLVESTRVPARQAPGLAPLRRVDVRSATP
jgi:hypothetical protein